MAVLPVNSVRFNNSTAVNFGRRVNKETENQENNYKSQKASGMVTVPAALLLALATSAINSSQPVAAQPTESETRVEMVSTASQASRSNTAPQFKDIFHRLPYYSEYLSEMRMKMSLPVTTTGGGKSNLVFASAGQADNKNVEYIYFIPDGYNNKRKELHPPKVEALRYHNLGGEKDYCGLVIKSYRQGSNGVAKTVTSERRIDDNTANLLIDLIAGDSKYVNKSKIEFEETSDPKLMQTY